MDALFGILFLTMVVTCVARSTETTCQETEEYRADGSESTCQELLLKPCLKAEKKPGCYCKQGTIRDEEGECISMKECSDRICTKTNTRLDMSGCYSYCTGRRTYGIGCPFRPHPKCNCERGFASQNRNCIPDSSCVRPETTCQETEDYRNEGSEFTCQEVLLEPCLKALRAERKPGCYCKRGTIRDEVGECISMKECSDRICTETNTRLDMSSGCFSYCTGRRTYGVSCNSSARAQPKCTCERGYALQNGNCIPDSSCTERTIVF